MTIRGVNLGGWLLMEGYILHGRNIPESAFKESFRKVNGKRGLAEFERLYRDAFITDADFENIARLGAGIVRLPFNHRLIERKPFRYSDEGFGYLEQALSGAQRHGLKVILDLHAAPGAQNADWHGDSNGRALLWESDRNLERTYALWERVADRFKEHPALMGYDVLNEPVIDVNDEKRLQNFYHCAIQRIRAVDKAHIIFVEGNQWATRIDFLPDILDDNVTISIHAYVPLSYTFNFRPFYSFPGEIDGARWDEGTLRRHFDPYREVAQKHGIEIFVGEFGVNWRGGHFGEAEWLASMLKVFDEYGFGYAYWTYKAVANEVFPDGIYQYLPNPSYVRREGPVYGFENYIGAWEKEKAAITDFWSSRNYTKNESLAAVLQQHLSGGRVPKEN